MAEVESTCEPEAMESEDPSFTLYTSGSTGKPKGIQHSTAGYLLYASVTHQVGADSTYRYIVLLLSKCSLSSDWLFTVIQHTEHTPMHFVIMLSLGFKHMFKSACWARSSCDHVACSGVASRLDAADRRTEREAPWFSDELWAHCNIAACALWHCWLVVNIAVYVCEYCMHCSGVTYYTF